MMPCQIPRYLGHFLDQPFEAVLSTKSPSGYPQQTVMWFLRQEDTLLMTSPSQRVKVRNARLDPQSSLLVVGPGCYVSFRGLIRIENEPAATVHQLATLVLERYLAPGNQGPMLQDLLDPTRVILRFLPRDYHSHRIKAWTKQRGSHQER